uniref:Terpene synthase 11 n=1 Tax=Dictyostelium purpureum TaxID=5786 RepID=TPS11_DICPU|nr:RecName: Full=Terpene synthase 11 [Dictyostelium purpureum]AXN72980.1 terpene synthase [Dictyostelium purpureum]
MDINKQKTKWDISIFKNENFTLPVIKSPFNTYYNKYIDSVINDIEEWHRECCFLGREKLKGYIESKPYLFSAYYYCHLNEKVLPFIIKFVDMFSIYDDEYLEKTNCSEDVINQFLDKNYKDKNIYGVEWFKIVEGLKKYGNKQSVNKFLKEFEFFIKNVHSIHLKENANYTNINFEEYTNTRSIDFGFDLVVSAAIIDCEEPSKEIRESSLFLTLNTKSSIICVLVNDIYSFVKESKQPDTMNYVKIMANKKKSIQKALNHTNKIINNTLKEIISIENQIKMQYKENNLYQYIERLNSVISATIYLHQNHKRYSVHNKNYINKNN